MHLSFTLILVYQLDNLVFFVWQDGTEWADQKKHKKSSDDDLNSFLSFKWVFPKRNTRDMMKVGETKWMWNEACFLHRIECYYNIKVQVEKTGDDFRDIQSEAHQKKQLIFLDLS